MLLLILVSTLTLGKLNYDEYKVYSSPMYSEMTNKGVDCNNRRGSCYYWGVFNYEGKYTEVNIGRVRYSTMEIGNTYDMKPMSFNWVMGISGLAYTVYEIPVWLLFFKILLIALPFAFLIVEALDKLLGIED